MGIVIAYHELEQTANEVVNQSGRLVEDRLGDILQATMQAYGLKMGLVSHVKPEEDAYIVKAFAPHDAGLYIGQTFAFSTTYCDITMRFRKAIGIQHMKISDHKTHPCYEVFKLEAYLGAPIFVMGKLYGTLNLTSPQPYERPFTSEDRNLMEALAKIIAPLLTLEEMPA